MSQSNKIFKNSSNGIFCCYSHSFKNYLSLKQKELHFCTVLAQRFNRLIVACKLALWFFLLVSHERILLSSEHPPFTTYALSNTIRPKVPANMGDSRVPHSATWKIYLPHRLSKKITWSNVCENILFFSLTMCHLCVGGNVPKHGANMLDQMPLESAMSYFWFHQVYLIGALSTVDTEQALMKLNIEIFWFWLCIIHPNSPYSFMLLMFLNYYMRMIDVK